MKGELPNPVSSVPPIARAAWLVVVMLMPVALLNYLDRQMLASMKYSVMADIPTIRTDESWGIMLGQFKWVYAVCSVIGGYIADRFSRRYVICISLLAWSAITYATGHATTYSALLWTRSLMGVSEAFYIPAALALIADFHVGNTRSRAVGLHQMAIYCGVIVGGFSGYLADAPDFGWRYAFSACGIVGMLYALPLMYLLRDAPRFTNEVATDDSRARHTIGQLLTNMSFLLLVLYFTLPAMAGWVVRDWMPAVLKQQYNISQGQAGVAATLPWQLAAIFGAIGGGWLADRWMQTNKRGRIYASAIGMCLIAPAMFAVGHAPTLWAAISCLVLFGIGWGFFDCNNMPILAQIVKPNLRATGYGLMNFVSISCGGFADWGFGKLRDRQVPLSQIVGIFALAAVVSIALVLLIQPKQDIVSEREA
jgi:MFS family permease